MTQSMRHPDSLTVKQLEQAPSKALAHTAEFLSRYPGERIRFYTHLEAPKKQAELTVSIFLPKGMEFRESFEVEGDRAEFVYLRELDDWWVVDWRLHDPARSGNGYQFVTEADVGHPVRETWLSSKAELRDSRGNLLDDEWVQVAVKVHGRYMRHLPELYHDNDFLNRFLMFFESFWKPIELQIAQGDVYYDPKLTPTSFLPWLATWLGVPWDPFLTEPRKRELLRSAFVLYKQRGTKQALERYLQIYTGGEVSITEHRAHNFVLGPNAYLGSTIALGTKNYPHTFVVSVKIHQEHLIPLADMDQKQIEAAYLEKIRAIIESQKPAHTAFELKLQVIKSKRSGKSGQSTQQERT